MRSAVNGTTGPPPSAYPAYPHGTGYLDITVQHVRAEPRLLSPPGRPAAIRINGENVHLPMGTTRLQVPAGVPLEVGVPGLLAFTRPVTVRVEPGGAVRLFYWEPQWQNSSPVISPTPISDSAHRAPTTIMLTLFGVLLVTAVIPFLAFMAFLIAIGAWP